MANFDSGANSLYEHPATAAQFAYDMNYGHMPWKTVGLPWSDSMKEQYFNLLSSDNANQHELDMWRLNNEYNTPEKQMERMVKAGINPAAAYQNISSGTSGSAPGTHMSGTARWHDTADRLATIDTIMNTISSIIGDASTIVNGTSGVQDIVMAHQGNWLNEMRYNWIKHGTTGSAPGLPSFRDTPSEGNLVPDIQVAPGVWMTGNEAMLFPELRSGLSTSPYEYGIHEARQEAYEDMVEMQTRIDKISQDLFDAVEKGDWKRVLSDGLQVLYYKFVNGRISYHAGGRRFKQNNLKKNGKK